MDHKTDAAIEATEVIKQFKGSIVRSNGAALARRCTQSKRL